MQRTELTTSRLELRMPSIDDAGAMCRFAIANREHHEPWSPQRDESFYTVAYWQEEFEAQHARYRNGVAVAWIFSLRDGKRQHVIGFANLNNIVHGSFQAAHLGYGLDVDEVGKGYMHEALEAVVGHAFKSMNLHRVMANYIPSNERSANVLRQLGFHREGIARKYLRINGRWQDHILTAKINDSWHLQ